MKHVLLVAIILAGSMANAIVSKPRDPFANKPLPGKIGIGNFEQEQSMVIHFMGYLGWNDETMYEETGLKMKDLLLKFVRKNAENKKWVLEVNKYFSSAEFINSDQASKALEIFQTKLNTKLAIQADGLLDEGKKHKN